MHMYYVNDGVHGSFNGIFYDHLTVEASLLDVSIITLRAKLAVQCIVIGPVCVCMCLWVCLLVCLWVCYHDNSKLRASIFTKLGL